MRSFTIKTFILVPLLVIFVSCRKQAKPVSEVSFYETELFREVQLNAIFEDSKTFVDLVPKIPQDQVIGFYEEQKNDPDFDLKQFVEEYFSDQATAVLQFETDTTKNMYEHLSSIWPKLTRGPDSIIPYSSRLVLPYQYVVPGGRFKEIYYWDSYFTLEGLLVDGQEKLARNMVANFTHLIDSLGFIPNGTRDYYLGRSQPPFYAMMVNAVVGKDSLRLVEYLPALLKEYGFWMEGSDRLMSDKRTVRHVVKINDSTVLNRYWDSKLGPRPEAYKEDSHLAAEIAAKEDKQELYTNLRAGAASGWDYSSRWYQEEGDFSSTATARIAPVDLNCLLFYLETQIANAYRIKGENQNEKKYRDVALERASRIQHLFWDPEEEFFTDYNFSEDKLTGEFTLAATYPLYFGIASEEQARAVKDRLMKDFLKDGGLLTTLKNTGQQWDAPNGWAPLQWMAAKGLLNYGYQDEAREIMTRWLAVNERVYKNTGKMMEKYNVEDISLISGGGEYKTQDGFGWTNGVALGFRKILDEMESESIATGQ
ncbi:MAG: alpha,alpha-trehalase TreF [Flavobacteriaceae bacterium]